MTNRTYAMTDLLIERATRGLTAEQETQLTQHLRAAGKSMAEFSEYDRAVAAVDNAIAATRGSATDSDNAGTTLPSALKRKLVAAADRFFSRSESNIVRLPTRASEHQARPSKMLSLGGWATAAVLLVLVLAGQLRRPAPSSAPDHAALLAQIHAEPDTISAAWSRPDAPSFRSVTGEVIWNDRLQAGYMRLTGMPVNEPDEWQYQLWIVDPERDERPVDGGVFDIRDATSEWLIPIDAKLAVDRPTVFAITREKPGGVVVSDGPLLVIASV